jgi:hypothetical protein
MGRELRLAREMGKWGRSEVRRWGEDEGEMGFGFPRTWDEECMTADSLILKSDIRTCYSKKR